MTACSACPLFHLADLKYTASRSLADSFAAGFSADRT